ncbi:MAG: Nudix family hydrolase [Limnobacter sp.]|nr:Nudix family hydrolase [Limnobacter sp.]
MKRIDVAVAVVFNAQGDVLWGQRPQGKPYAGYWEFPGGKVEADETVWQALVRELQEELGITAQQGGPWFVMEHDYEHAKVRLHLYRVWQFEGTPRALEGQTLTWSSLQPGHLQPVLPATEPLLPVLAQPGVLAVSSYGLMGADAVASKLQPAQSPPDSQRTGVAPFVGKSAGGMRVLFREPELVGQTLVDAWQHCQQICSALTLDLICHSATALRLLEAGCELPHGLRVHLTQTHLETRPQFAPHWQVLGASVHDAASLQLAHARGLHYAVLGAVRATASHPGQGGMGWAAFQQLVQEARLPVYAIGGLGLDDWGEARIHGAHGLAMIRQL